MNQAIWGILAIIIAVLLDLYVIKAWRRYRQLKSFQKKTGLPIARRDVWKRTMISEQTNLFFVSLRKRTLGSEHFRRSALVTIELILIALWSIYVGKAYLNFDPFVIPAGREFNSAIQTHHLWTQFQKCGWCAVWNGFERGGYPAFADIHGSMLHPVVMITSLLWGVLKGAKITLIVSFWFAGVAQWWIARELRLGLIPRLWSAGMAVVGGHLAGRMELGAFGVVLSTAMCSLVFGGILTVARGGGKRSAVILGVLTASALVSGQGYIQVGLLGIIPAIPFLLFDDDRRLLPVWKDYALAFILALLLAAPFLIPFIHFAPNFVKETDPNFNSAQSLTYLPLNLVIDDWEYYNTEILGKFPYPHLYSLYIGWIPVILALIGLSKAQQKDRRFIWFMGAGIILEFLIGSAVLLKRLTFIIPAIAGIRHPPQIAGLAIPLILGLSAYGLDYLIHLPWPTLWVGLSEKLEARSIRLSLYWLLLIPLFLSLKSGYEFTKAWVYTDRSSEKIQELLEELKTETLQWVNPPFGEHFYIEPAVNMGLKLSPGILTFRWKDREMPVAMREANRKGPPPGPVQKIAEVDDIPIYERLDQPYAAVYSDNAQQPCQAYGSGGHIDVYCNTTTPGTLYVKENMWSGWKVWLDGERLQLLGSEWLGADAPAGSHVYQFRYQPWDVPLGIFFLFLGCVLCVYLWRANPKSVTGINLLVGFEQS